METGERVAIVGGGVLGLTLALRFAERGARVTVYEAAAQIGGLADAWEVGGVRWDRHYHVTLLSDAATRALAAELGIEDYRWVRTRTGFYTGGRHHSMSDTLEFLRFPPLGLIDKLRLGLTILYASRLRNGERLEAIPVVPWLRRLSGERTTEKIWLPLLRAKLGENAAKASAAFIWAIIARMYAARRSGLKHELFGYAPGGYARLMAAFQARLAALGVEIRCASPVEGLRSDDTGVSIQTHDGSHTYDRAVVTVAAPSALRMIEGLSAAERTRLERFTYQGIVCASAVLRKPLRGYYVTNITDPAPYSAVIEMTALVDPAEFGGRSLVYLPKYLPCDHPDFELDDATVQERFTSALLRMYPELTPEDILAFRITRTRYVLPVATLNYSRSVPPFVTSLPGVFLANSTQIVNGTLNVNETVSLAERAAEAIAAHPVQRAPAAVR